MLDDLSAPLLVTWQLTRDCDLACLHCCTESAPGKRLPDELDAAEAQRVAEDIVRIGRSLRHAVRRRAAGGAAFLPRCRAARARRHRSSRSRPTASGSTPTSPRGLRACRFALSR